MNRGVFTSCIPKFTFAIQPGYPYVVEYPLPTVGVTYQFMIKKVTNGRWLLWIMSSSGTVIVSSYIDNVGMNYGNTIMAFGEVNSPRELNDMGIARLLSLKWMKVNNVWSYWNGWIFGIVDTPPYNIIGVSPDIYNNVKVFGNNGNPVPPGAPCP